MKPRVLIVEDEVIVADDLAYQLEQMGYEVVGTAVSGEEALEIVDEEQPAIVLMDIQLQGEMNGIQTARQIERKSNAAVIFLTAFAGIFLIDPAQMQPPGICLSKPFSPSQLKAALNSVNGLPAVN